MSALSDQQLREMIQEGESDRVEFKESLKGDAPTRIREAICAFANDLPAHKKPGFIIVGVRDDRSLKGISDTDDLLRKLADMKTDGNILPPPTMTFEKRTLDGHDIAVVAVEPSDTPPVRFKYVVHIRLGPRRGVATEQDERILKEKRLSKNIFFDIQRVPTSQLSDLSMTLFENEYLPQAFAPEILEANNRSLNEQLAATKMIVSPDDPTPTVLGLLVLGKRTLDFLPGAHIQFLRIDGIQITDEIVDEEAIGGTVLDVVQRIREKLNAHNRVSIDILSGPIERRTHTYPLEAVHQIVINAIMHRSYEGNNAPTRVYWYNDRIEINSPGGAYGITPDNFGQYGYTSYRNPNLAEAMKMLGLVQRFGYGIPLAKDLLKKAGHPDIEFNVNHSFVFATIKRRKQIR